MILNLIVKHASNYQLGFQIPASPVMEGIINFHHDLFFFFGGYKENRTLFNNHPRIPENIIY